MLKKVWIFLLNISLTTLLLIQIIILLKKLKKKTVDNSDLYFSDTSSGTTTPNANTTPVITIIDPDGKYIIDGIEYDKNNPI